MSEFLASIAGILLIIVVPAVLILLLRDKIWGLKTRESEADRQQRRAAWRERMMRPEVENVEEFCGGKLPQRLIEMYSDRDFILSHDFEVCAPRKDPERHSWWIGDFEPMTVPDQKLTCDLTEIGKGFCFAGDGMGNFYWVPVDDEQRKDAPVYFACHDPWGNEKVAESLDEFLSWSRVSKGKS